MITKKGVSPAIRKSQSIKSVVLPTVLLLLLIPPIVFSLVALSSGLSPGDTMVALANQFTSRKQNLLVVGLLSLLPVALMVFVIWLIGKIKRFTVGARELALGGAVGILATACWMNFEYWTTFLPEMTYAGFPHGLEFVLGPVFYAPVMMLLGMFAAALAARKKTSS